MKYRFKFSLRTLLTLCLAAGCFVGWYAYRVRQQRALMLSVADRGALAYYSLEYYQREPDAVPVARRLANLVGDDCIFTVRGLEIHGSDTDAELLDDLQQNANINYIMIEDDAMEPKTFEKVLAWQGLKLLKLARVDVVDDTCVDRLASMKSLQSLDIRQTHISRRGLKKLQRELPLCMIRHDWEGDPNKPSTF